MREKKEITNKIQEFKQNSASLEASNSPRDEGCKSL
jgi:hypothetical protein